MVKLVLIYLQKAALNIKKKPHRDVFKGARSDWVVKKIIAFEINEMTTFYNLFLREW